MSASRPILFENCRLAFPDFIAEGALLADGGQIQAIWINEKPSSVPSNAQRIDCRDLILAPGLIDIHNHGGVTHDFVNADPEGNNIALKYHADHGVTAMLATIMTETPEQMAACMKTLGDQHRGAAIHRNFLGIHVEGPYFNPAKRGCHKIECLRDPDPREYTKFWELSNGLIRIFTHAPERKGSLEFCRYFNERGCVPTIGHTKASMAQIRAAAAYGARHFVHANNAIDWPARTPRADGWLGTELMGMGTLLSHTAMTGEIISDGYHVPVEMIRVILNAKGADNVAIVSDSSSAVGCKPGTYSLGGLDIILDYKRLVLSAEKNDDGVSCMAGSGTPLIEMLKNYLKWGFGFLTPLRMATIVPARIIGETKRGILRVGNFADLILVDDQFNLKLVFIAGTEAHRSNDAP
jgi:N-acetylglucosamine-6-phosphate deacetylase